MLYERIAGLRPTIITKLAERLIAPTAVIYKRIQVLPISV